MTGSMKCPIVAAYVVLIIFCPLTASAEEVLGKKPRHVWGGPSSVPNDQAITKRIWAAGIDDGYVPQGVTWADGAIYLSGYRSTDPKIDKGPCRIYKVDAESGKTLGEFDLPQDCGHAGGLTFIENGILVAADTRRLYKIDARSAFAGQNASAAVIAAVKLSGQLKGSFVDFDGTSIFVGSYEKDVEKAKGHFLPLSIFGAHSDKAVNEVIAVRTISIPVESQGAAFDKEGNLWIAASSSKFGTLYKLDAKTGRVLSSHEMVIGIEDLAFDDEGRLWSVSEAGSIRWLKWAKTYPLLFRIDLNKLK
jgi:outer membrane protein assembly factor BamB